MPYPNTMQSKNKTYLTLMAILSIMGLALYLLPFQGIRPLNEDYSTIYYVKDFSYQTIKKIFTTDAYVDFCTDCGFLENYQEPVGFLRAYYRPFHFLIISIIYKLFGISTAAYFIANVLLHTINTVFIFIILNWISSLLLAFLGASFFLFHASYYKWIYNASALQDPINLLCLLIMFLSFYQYVNKKSYTTYVFSHLFFILALLTREMAIIAPFIIVLYLFFQAYLTDDRQPNKLNFIIKNSLLFFILAAAYMMLRLYLFGPPTIGPGFFSNLTTEPIGVIKNHLWNIIETLKNLFGSTFLAHPSPYYKIVFLAPLLSLFFFCFIQNSQKIIITLLCIATIFAAWPAFYIPSCHTRYIYPALPYFILALILCIEKTTSIIKPYATIFLYLFFTTGTGWGIYENWQTLTRWQTVAQEAECCLHQFHTEHKSLFTQNKQRCFVGLPNEIFGMGLMQALHMYSGDYTLTARQIPETFFCQNQIIKKNITPGLTVTYDGFILSSNNPQEIFWLSDTAEQEGVGHPIKRAKNVMYTMHKRTGPEQTSKISIAFEKKDLKTQKEIILLYWNGSGFSAQKFTI